MLKPHYLFKNLFLFIISFSVIDVFAVIHVKDYVFELPMASGTPEREEYEFKYAIKDTGNVSVKSIAKHIEETILDIQKRKLFHLEKIVHEKYYLNDQFQSFIFKDYYYDTPQNDILKNNSALRMRYRWTSPQSHFLYQFFPFIKLFYPNRCEFQFKRNYTFPIQGFAKVYESRFEFRDASEPFVNRFSAPEAPWPFEEFESYLKSGYFKKYKMTPLYNMARLLSQTNIQIIDLEKKIECITNRYRSHLNIETPWGTGPNPTHAFILTIDHTISDQISFYEIEIEVERNVSTAMNALIDAETENDPVKIEARELSLQAKNAIIKDLELIQKGLLGKISKNIIQLPTMFKYKRMMSHK